MEHNNFPGHHLVLPYIATEEDIVREYSSIDNFKQFMNGKGMDEFKLMAEKMLKKLQGIPPTIFLFSKFRGVEKFDLLPVTVQEIMDRGTPQQAAKYPHPAILLRAEIASQFAGPSSMRRLRGEKVYATIFFSEAYVSHQIVPVDAKEVNLISAAKDPLKTEVVLIKMDFIFGGADLFVFELLRPAGKSPELKPLVDPLFGKINAGHMDGLLRKTAGVYKAIPLPVKVNIRK